LTTGVNGGKDLVCYWKVTIGYLEMGLCPPTHNSWEHNCVGATINPTPGLSEREREAWEASMKGH
jgi:hypothetical protein